MDATLERNNKLKALAGTLLFHGLIFILFFLIVFKNPDPPMFSDTAGIEVNFGLSEDGMGDVQPEPASSQARASQAMVEAQKNMAEDVSKEEKLLTQEVDDAPAVASSEKPKKDKRPVVKTNPTPVIKESKKEERKEVKEEKKEPVVNTNALYKGKTKSGNEGETGKAGDQGIKEGSLYVKNHGNQMGQGDHGTGDGAFGNGGTGGKGISFSLGGRKLFQAPKISDNSQETGRVVVDIIVNKYGTVTSANPGGRGSTTSSANLYRKAKEAALKAKFNASPEGVEEQRGTITFVFIVQ